MRRAGRAALACATSFYGLLCAAFCCCATVRELSSACSSVRELSSACSSCLGSAAGCVCRLLCCSLDGVKGVLHQFLQQCGSTRVHGVSYKCTAAACRGPKEPLPRYTKASGQGRHLSSKAVCVPTETSCTGWCACADPSLSKFGFWLSRHAAFSRDTKSLSASEDTTTCSEPRHCCQALPQKAAPLEEPALRRQEARIFGG